MRARFTYARYAASASITHATLAVLAAAAILALTACGGGRPPGTSPRPAGEAPAEATGIILASTTSTDDSGLFGALIPAFEDAYPSYKVSVLAVGTGQAFQIGRAKDADVLLVHSTSDEEAFVAEGWGMKREDVMYNDYLIVGPPADPAGVKGSSDAVASLGQIAAGGFDFVSRGDDSGTHKAERALWSAAGVETTGGPWYLSIGQGMGDTLTFASEKQGYTLADRATYLSMRDRLDLEILVAGDPALFNQYGVIVVAGANNPKGAQAFFDWVLSPEGQAVIESFGVDTYGEPLFVPNAR